MYGRYRCRCARHPKPDVYVCIIHSPTCTYVCDGYFIIYNRRRRRHRENMTSFLHIIKYMYIVLLYYCFYCFSLWLRFVPGKKEIPARIKRNLKKERATRAPGLNGDLSC